MSVAADVKRRTLVAALLGAPWIAHRSFAAASDWLQRFGYPTGWGPRHDWTDKNQRVGNYSGGYEKMFPTHMIAASAPASALRVDLREPPTFTDAAGASKTVGNFLEAWPTTGLLIARKGTILFERYQFDRTPEMRLTSWSMAKSVTSLLLGICIDRGLVRSLDDKPDLYVPELKGTLHGGITLRHLANMSSGAAILHDRDNFTLYPKMLLDRNADLETVVREWTASAEPPGTRFNYNELCPLTIGMVIRRVTGGTLAQFCQQALWQPLGAEADASWFCDAKEKEFNCIGFGARLRDWARLGQMLAQNGVMQGRQVVSEKWVRECSSWSDQDAQVRHGVGMRGMGYKCFFWHPKADGSWMMMNGHHGQRVLVDRVTQTVLVHTAVEGEPPWQQDLFRLFAAATRMEG